MTTTKSKSDVSLASVIDEKLIELEFECDSITLDEVYERYRDHEWNVLECRTGEAGVFAVVNNNLSEKGIRHFLALVELEAFAFCDDGGGIERREPVMSSREDPTAEIDPGLSH